MGWIIRENISSGRSHKKYFKSSIKIQKCIHGFFVLKNHELKLVTWNGLTRCLSPPLFLFLSCPNNFDWKTLSFLHCILIFRSSTSFLTSNSFALAPGIYHKQNSVLGTLRAAIFRPFRCNSSSG